MNIRTKLLIYVLTIVTLLNSIAFFLFQSAKYVESSYNEILQQFLLYNQVSSSVTDNLRTLNLYLINRTQESHLAFQKEHDLLQNLLQSKLSQIIERPDNYLKLNDYRNMVQTFLDQENEVDTAINSHSGSAYTDKYHDAETTAGYIQETTQSIINLDLTSYSPFYQEIAQKSDQLRQIGMLIFISTTLLSVLIGVSFSRGITEPLQRLMHVARRMSLGDLEGDQIVVRSRDEMGVLSESFNLMQRNIRNLVGRIQEQAELDRHVKDLELKALQSQINPHFLFNSLNSIAKLAYMEGAEKSSDLITSISTLLRYNLQKLDRPVSLRDELDNVTEYLTIQRARFRDRVEYQFEIEEEALEIQVPCLILQPIVENAFVHGIEDIESDAVLFLKIAREDQGVKITVRDNGKGIDQETKANLIASFHGDIPASPLLEKRKSTGIGLTNVGKRLSLFYEKQFKIEIISEIDQGTTILLWLPAFSQNRKE